MDVLECPECHGPMRILSAIHAPEAIQKILDCLSLPPRVHTIAPALPERKMDEPYLCCADEQRSHPSALQAEVRRISFRARAP